MPTPQSSIIIYIDADACPVKQEVYRVAERHGVKVVVVSNSPIAVPRDPGIERIVVAAGMDKADDFIAERAAPGAIVITADVPLAARAVKAGAVAFGERLAVRRKLDRLDARDPQSDGPAPLRRRGHRRTEAVLGEGPLGLSRQPGSRDSAVETGRLCAGRRHRVNKREARRASRSPGFHPLKYLYWCCRLNSGCSTSAGSELE